MDAMLKNLSINEAKRLVHKLVDSSDIDTIENFWLFELDNLHLGIKDSNTFDEILSLKNKDTDTSNILYNNCVKGNVIHDLIKRNWRRLFNNNIVEKYNEYKNKITNQGDKVWVMS